MGFQGGSVIKNPPASPGDTGDMGLIPGWGRFPWRRKWKPTPVFLPGESHGQRAWRATVHEVEKSWTQLSTHAHIYMCMCAKPLQSFLILYNPMDYSLPAPLSMGFSRQEYWSGLPFPSPEDLPKPGMEPGSPAIRATSCTAGK